MMVKAVFRGGGGSLRGESEGFAADASVAERDFRGLPSRALVEPTGTVIVIVRHSLARRQRSLMALVEAGWGWLGWLFPRLVEPFADGGEDWEGDGNLVVA